MHSVVHLLPESQSLLEQACIAISLLIDGYYHTRIGDPADVQACSVVQSDVQSGKVKKIKNKIKKGF